MSEYVCLLVTIMHKTELTLFRVALKVKRDGLSEL